ncbi:MAG: glucose/arabinose dehydrogenase, partial [Verrucomicrobiales bacterium]
PGTRIYSFAFAPEPDDSRYLYVFLTYPGAKKPGGSRIIRYNLAESSVDYESNTLIFHWESWGHTGGSIRFGPDEMLYIGIGDGGSDYPADPRKTGQNIGDVFSSVLRISPNGCTNDCNYSIPRDNPFVGVSSARGEVWAYGLRNPWRMAFDKITGDLWLADVGWDRREMVHLIQRGGNYGWSVTEGREILDIYGSRGVTQITPPVVDHPHSEAMSITGESSITDQNCVS